MSCSLEYGLFNSNHNYNRHQTKVSFKYMGDIKLSSIVTNVNIQKKAAVTVISIGSKVSIILSLDGVLDLSIKYSRRLWRSYYGLNSKTQK